jgi:hypothetical protein
MSPVSVHPIFYDEFVKLYVTERLSAKEICRRFKIATSRFYKLKKLYGIPRPIKSQAEYRRENTVRMREYRRDDPNFRLAAILRTGLYQKLRDRNKSKQSSAVILLGASVSRAVQHIEKMFDKKMSWENWGKYWEIDHIRPLASFDLGNLDELRQACHFTNLRPLRRIHNRRKSAHRELLI